MTKYFGTDGVRGVANEELSPELAFKLGRFGGYILSKDYGDNERPQVMIARDTRASGKMLEYAMIAGLNSVGVDVMRLGVTSTPALAYLTRVQAAAAGVMISASHNPAQDNGIKFFNASGYKLSDEQEAAIEELLNKEEDTLPRPSAAGIGDVEDYKEGSFKYAQFLTQTIPGDLSGLKVVLDGAHGATYNLLDRLFADLECDFDVIGASPNGININDGVGSTHPELLAEKVVELGADVGLAFDGDGDRVIVVDEKGQVIDGDQIMYIIATHLHNEQLLKKDTVVSTVMSNLGFYKSLEEKGIASVQTDVGDRYVVQEMRENGYNFGGEQSGHIVLHDFHTTGDGLLTGIQFMHVLKESNKTVSELASEMKIYPQVLINVRVSDKNGALNNEKIKAVIEEIEAELEGNGRILVRPSGTEPVLRVMVEAETQEKCQNSAERIAAVVEAEMGLSETE